VGSLLVTIVGLGFAAYGSFCYGAEWARRRSRRAAKRSHQQALEWRQGLLQQLEAMGDPPQRDRERAVQYRRLIEDIELADEEVGRALAVANYTWYEAGSWSYWIPWVHWLTWGQRIDAVRDWWRGRRWFARARKDWQRETSEPLSDDDQRMLDEVKRNVLRD
jgi:hypothetical protein